MKNFLFISIIILSYSIGDVLVTKAMKEVGEIYTLNPRKLIAIFWRVVGNYYVIAGGACELLALLAYMAVLSWADLSLVLPSTAFSDVVVLIAAKYLLREHVGVRRWLGVVCISIGVVLISIS